MLRYRGCRVTAIVSLSRERGCKPPPDLGATSEAVDPFVGSVTAARVLGFYLLQFPSRKRLGSGKRVTSLGSGPEADLLVPEVLGLVCLVEI